MEDSKLMKFKLLVDELDNYFLAARMTGISIPGFKKSGTSLNFFDNMKSAMMREIFSIYNHCKFALENKTANETQSSIYNSQIIKNYNKNSYIAELDKKFNDDKAKDSEFEFVMFYKKHEITPYNQKSAYRLIFWLLFAAAVADEIYNNELSTIIDMAYCMDFSESMIRDWCRAVEYVLNGNKLSKDCDLKCETDEGNSFFKHSLIDVAKMNNVTISSASNAGIANVTRIMQSFSGK